MMCFGCYFRRCAYLGFRTCSIRLVRAELRNNNSDGNGNGNGNWQWWWYGDMAIWRYCISKIENISTRHAEKLFRNTWDRSALIRCIIYKRTRLVCIFFLFKRLNTRFSELASSWYGMVWLGHSIYCMYYCVWWSDRQTTSNICAYMYVCVCFDQCCEFAWYFLISYSLKLKMMMMMMLIFVQRFEWKTSQIRAFGRNGLIFR